MSGNQSYGKERVDRATAKTIKNAEDYISLNMFETLVKAGQSHYSPVWIHSQSN